MPRLPSPISPQLPSGSGRHEQATSLVVKTSTSTRINHRIQQRAISHVETKAPRDEIDQILHLPLRRSPSHCQRRRQGRRAMPLQQLPEIQRQCLCSQLSAHEIPTRHHERPGSCQGVLRQRYEEWQYVETALLRDMRKPFTIFIITPS